MNTSIDQLRSHLQEIDEENTQLEINITSKKLNFKVRLEELKHALESTCSNVSGNETTSSIVDSPVADNSLAKSVVLLKRAFPSPSKLIDLSNRELVTKHLTACFEILQQITCKVVAKAWIKQVTPKKQSLYPYKGGRRTKPPWWPEDVPHKEPDHLLKKERVLLMLSIILTKDLATVSGLMNSTSGCNSMLSEMNLSVLNEIYLIKEKLDSGKLLKFEVSDFALLKALRAKNRTTDVSKLIQFNDGETVNALSHSKLLSKKLRIPTFDDENLQPNISTGVYSSTSQGYTELDRVPLGRKDPNLLPAAKRSRLEKAAWNQVKKLYDSSISLSPGAILSSTPTKVKEDLELSVLHLPPLKMMHKVSSPSLRKRVKLNMEENLYVQHNDTDTDTDTDIIASSEPVAGADDSTEIETDTDVESCSWLETEISIDPLIANEL